MSNPLLHRLGFEEDARLVLLHTDDVGMCQASLAAYADLLEVGFISTASTMVPCPWFPAVAEFCRRHADVVDMGVHTTLTCEWGGYRWGPLTTLDPASGLVDEEGYLPHTRAEVAQQADPQAVRQEIAAQLDQALAWGVDVTHLDTHMGTAFHPPFVLAYVEEALQRGIPPMLPRLTREEAMQRSDLQEMGMSQEDFDRIQAQLQALEGRGVPLLNGIHGFPLDQPEGRAEQVRAFFAHLEPGITHVINHAARDTPELRAITPDWRGRVADYEAFTSRELRDEVRAMGITFIGWRQLRDSMRERMQ